MEPLPEISCAGASVQLNRKTTDMVSFLAAHGRQLDPALPDGNCLFRSLAKQLTGDPSKHVQLRETLTKFIAQNPQVFTTGWLRETAPWKSILKKVQSLVSGEVILRSRQLPQSFNDQYMLPLTHSFRENVCGQFSFRLVRYNLPTQTLEKLPSFA